LIDVVDLRDLRVKGAKGFEVHKGVLKRLSDSKEDFPPPPSQLKKPVYDVEIMSLKAEVLKCGLAEDTNPVGCRVGIIFPVQHCKVLEDLVVPSLCVLPERKGSS